MYHYYYDGPDGAHDTCPATQVAEEPVRDLPAGPEPQPVPEPPEERRPRKGRSERGAAAVLLGLTLVLGGLAVALAIQARPLDISAMAPAEGYMENTQTVVVDLELQRYPNGDGTTLTLANRPETVPLSFQEIYRQVSPSVVSITALLPMGASQGTGVVMTADGYIITNAHVIEGAFRADVSLEDGRSFEAKLVGSDESTDLAVLKVEATDLTPAVFGDSDQMVVGDTVVAIGNPMGEQLRGTMTDGILSAINRDMEVDGNTMTLLQTTAALNTGNSGGALVNDQGQVIGITNMKLISNVSDNTLEGLGFAIPTTTVKPVVDALIAEGVVTGRPTLGVTVRPMYDFEQEEYGVDQGLLVVSVAAGSDAEGKLEEGDILLTANSTPLHTNDDLLAIRDELQAGDAIDFEVRRGEETLNVCVTLMEQYQLEE
ncbi:trypsin-like peptidase domain-containing protein [uncultured Intestinimonas sp.]|uniref:S1C family serine protease n=1 Tax=uncultured Intestinimonas sp. TaxID=1689265 RepID=UPI0025FA8830|nr:trypsin-like peptidase domain-containing protein [uncultured Intestinimonas sp.]